MLVIDASIAVKWVVEEDGTPEAMALRARGKLIAPDLLIAECANVLWKKVARREFSRDESLIAASLLERTDIELYPMRSLLGAAVRLAIELDHPAYDCLYLACAVRNNCRMVTADARFLQKVSTICNDDIRDRIVPLQKAGSE